jgi:broad specificity phosphatase PhoE
MRLVFVRHGETEWNRERRLQGQTDEPLSALGEQQSLALAPVIAANKPKRAFSSDLRRARTTAALLGFDDPVIDPRLREANLGAWSGRLIAEIVAEEGRSYQEWRAGRYTPTGGEEWAAFRGRVGDAISAITAPCDDDAVVVAHGGVIRAACDVLLGLSPASVVPVGPATLTAINLQRIDGRIVARLEAYNHGPSAPVYAAPD